VVIVGPVDAPGRDGEAAVDRALSKAAKASGRQYVSALDWDLEFLPDRAHLTPAGHATFAANVASALKS
jgi:acyl-CoA thioesterase-1